MVMSTHIRTTRIFAASKQSHEGHRTAGAGDMMASLEHDLVDQLADHQSDMFSRSFSISV